MFVPPPERTLVTHVIIASLLIASGAVYLTATQGDMLGPLFQHVLTGRVLVSIISWTCLAHAARRLLVGKLPKIRLSSRAALVWGGSRVALLIAVVMVLVIWITALTLGLAIKTALVRAMALLFVVTAFTGIIGGAFF